MERSCHQVTLVFSASLSQPLSALGNFNWLNPGDVAALPRLVKAFVGICGLTPIHVLCPYGVGRVSNHLPLLNEVFFLSIDGSLENTDMVLDGPDGVTELQVIKFSIAV